MEESKEMLAMLGINNMKFNINTGLVLPNGCVLNAVCVKAYN